MCFFLGLLASSNLAIQNIFHPVDTGKLLNTGSLHGLVRYLMR